MHPSEIARLTREAVAEAVGALVERHVEEVRELRRGLFVMKGLLSATEAGEVLGSVSSETVMEYVKEKGLPCYRPGRRPLFRLSELETWVAQFPDLAA